MTGRRSQTSEVIERRQIEARIHEMKSICENLDRTRNNLAVRLNRLNEIVDKLVDEKRLQKFDPSLKIDLNSDQICSKISSHLNTQHYDKQTQLTSTLATNDLTNQYNSSSRREQELISRSSVPSNAFKLKLSHCLQEIIEKAEEIASFSDLYVNNSNFE